MRTNNSMIFSKLSKTNNVLVGELTIANRDIFKTARSSAGGSSAVSETVSKQLFANLGFKYQHDETTIPYNWSGIKNQRYGVDFTCVKSGKIYAISCTRIFRYVRTETDEFIKNQHIYLDNLKHAQSSYRSRNLSSHAQMVEYKIARVTEYLQSLSAPKHLTEDACGRILARKIADIEYVRKYAHVPWHYSYLHAFTKDARDASLVAQVFADFAKHQTRILLVVTICADDIIYVNL